MSTTIFCTFEQCDFADLATGRIRRVRGVKSIHYAIGRTNPSAEEIMNRIGAGSAYEDAMGAASFGSGPVGIGGIVTDTYNNPSSSHNEFATPTTVKIVCDDKVRQQIVGMLVNMHAHKIVTTP